MENRVQEASVEKYYNALKELRNLLSYTNRISMNDFCEKNHLSKNLPNVLQKGGIIKCMNKGKYSQWEWISIEPNNHMAVKSIQMLGDLNPPRKKSTEKPILNDEKPKQNKKMSVGLLWGFIKFELCL